MTKCLIYWIWMIVCIQIHWTQEYYKPSRIINTNFGKVRGIRKRAEEFLTQNSNVGLPSFKGKWVDSYLGVPYAKPPVGKLRFRLPQATEPFGNDIYEAVKMSPSCPQIQNVLDKLFDYWNIRTTINEDCLYLNIWTPYNPNNSPLPVLFWIHGGGYVIGGSSADFYDGKIFSLIHNVIVVSINYRLGYLGFSYFGESTQNKGNLGLHDQQLAMKWVKENIRYFGGNPDLVTIAGQSAGASSVAIHQIIPTSWPYFKRAILQSGSATLPWAMTPMDVVKDASFHVAQILGCYESDNETSHIDAENEIIDKHILPCLRKKNRKEFIQKPRVRRPLNFIFTPIVDKKLIPDFPAILLKNEKVKKSELLCGSTLNESTIFLFSLAKWDVSVYGDTTGEAALRENAHLILDDFLFRFHKKEIVEAMKLFYSKHHSSSSSSRDTLNEKEDILPGMLSLLEDYTFICGLEDVAQSFTNMGLNVYKYEFRHRSTQSTWPEWVGSAHGDEIPFVFAIPFHKDSKHTTEERNFSLYISTLWANFIKYGNPNGRNVNREIWPNYKNNETLIIDSTVSWNDTSSTRKVIKNLKGKECTFQKHMHEFNNFIINSICT